jgi:hypothetical protein
MSTDWEARRAFNFARAAVEWPLVIEMEGTKRRRGEEAKKRQGEVRFLVSAAIAYDATQVLGRPFLLKSDELWVQFRPGVLQVKIKLRNEN